ncbi:MAG: hypothetical protein ACK502_07665 [Alphaproteobacteria bacterium]
MNLFRKSSPEHVLHELLPKLLIKKAPSRISLTGETAQLNDYYSIHFGNQYLVEDYNPNTRMLDVYTPDGNSAFTISTTVALSDALQYPLHVKYFYKTYWEDYTDVHRLVRDYKMRWVQIEVYCRIFWKNLSQWFFNQKPLWVIRDRMGLLEFIIERHLGSEGSITSPTSNNTKPTFSAFQLMTELRSSKWIYHPHSQKAKRRLDLFLDAFVASGDLVRDGIGYTLDPRAIQTLGDFHESKRRHTDAIRTQWLIGILTFIIAFAAIVQAYYAAKSSEQTSATILNNHVNSQ